MARWRTRGRTNHQSQKAKTKPNPHAVGQRRQRGGAKFKKFTKLVKVFAEQVVDAAA